MSTLFELSDEMQQLLEAIEFLGEDDQAVATVIDEYLGRLQGDLNTKLDNYAGLITELDKRIAARKEEADRLNHRAKVDANKVVRLKECLRWFFLTHDLTVIETPRYRLTLAANGGKLPVILTLPLEELPPDYVLETTTYRADMEAIRQALENGTEVTRGGIRRTRL